MNHTDYPPSAPFPCLYNNKKNILKEGGGMKVVERVYEGRGWRTEGGGMRRVEWLRLETRVMMKGTGKRVEGRDG